MSDAAHVELVAVVPIASWTGPGGGGRVPTRLLDELEIDRVIVAPGSSGGDELMFVIRALRDAGVKVSVIPDVSRLAGSAVQVDPIGGVSLLAMKRFAITSSSRAIKRSFDLLAASLIILVCFPLLIAIALAIRLEQPGSKVLYRQRRIGREGREFNILKFRSMFDGAHQMRAELAQLDSGAEGFFKIADDPRVTRVGRVIRRTNLDELPQLFNVIRGDMSLVGPRPLVPEEDANVAGLYRRRLDLAARDHRSLAGARLLAGAARRDGQARLHVRVELVPVERPRPDRQDDSADRSAPRPLIRPVLRAGIRPSIA